jgi:dTDP-4-amino-4,6-dideoxygalactose transaminase
MLHAIEEKFRSRPAADGALAQEHFSLTESSRDPIYVTRPFLPPLDELQELLAEIWSNQILTNNGPLHTRFEAALAEYLGVEHVALVANGTLALTVTLQTLKMSGEVITTPYSFVATSHALKLLGLEPVFVDVKRDDYSLDPARIEAAITPRTVAIMPVHCYGNPCDIAAIDAIAKRHGLRVIYDAAHAFGVKKDGATVLNGGDFSSLSFHATKAFNTFEGGAIVAPSAEAKLAINRMKNFGFRDEVTVESVGGNGKMSEFNAALGLLQLKYFEGVRKARRRVDAIYREALAGVEGIDCVPVPKGVEPNYSYFPILVQPDFSLSRDALYDRFKAANIHTRRYFYPLITDFPMYSDLPSAQSPNLPVATEIAKRILCLPIYPGLSESDQERVIERITGV